MLIGDASKAKKLLGWEAKISLEDLVSEMVHVAVHNASQPEANMIMAEF